MSREITAVQIFGQKPFDGMSETAVRLMLRMPYIMALYYSMAIYEDRSPMNPTLCVNGVAVWVNPDFWRQLSRDQKLTAIAHEIGHKMLLHPTRRGERNPYVWCEAGDNVINHMLVQSGFVPLTNMTINGKPWSWCCDAKYAGSEWTTELVYDDLIRKYEEQYEENQKGKEKGPGTQGAGHGDEPSESDGEGDGDDSDAEDDNTADTATGKGADSESSGTARSGDEDDDTGGHPAGRVSKNRLGPMYDVRDLGVGPTGERDADTKSPGDFEQQVRKEIKEAEMQAKMIGNTPAWLERVVGNAFHSKVNWFDVLEQYLRGLHQADYSWSRMNRREYVKTGVISPDIYQPQMGGILKFIDTSGSVSGHELALYDKHERDVIEQVKPKWVAMAYWDTQLHRLDMFERSDYTLDESMLKPVGGGGTDFRGFQDVIDSLDEPPDVVMVYTDMYATFPREELSVPTIWLSTSQIEKAPFGDVILIR
jgi:predicted metal-dependent peptidase